MRRAFPALGFSTVAAFLVVFALFDEGGCPPSFAICGGPPSVVASHDESSDVEYVVTRLAGVVPAAHQRVENHDRCAVVFEEPLQELHAASSESVSVGDHNFADSACTYVVQKGEETGAPSVEAPRGPFVVALATSGVANATSSRRFLLI